MEELGFQSRWALYERVAIFTAPVAPLLEGLTIALWKQAVAVSPERQVLPFWCFSECTATSGLTIGFSSYVRQVLKRFFTKMQA